MYVLRKGLEYRLYREPDRTFVVVVNGVAVARDRHALAALHRAYEKTEGEST